MAEEVIIEVADSPEDLKSLLAVVKKEQWRTIGKCDNELCFAADIDQHGFFTGYVQGEKVSHLNMVTYGEGEDTKHCIFGTFIVYPGNRGKGYGSKTWEYAWSKIPKNCVSISVTAVSTMAPKFQEVYGFEPAWTDYMFVLNVNEVASLIFPTSSSSLSITSYSTVDFNCLLMYDTSVFGYVRQLFVEKMLLLCNGWAALNEDGDIVGYCAMKESIVEKCGWVLGPWYANDINIARLLLIKAANFVSSLSQSDSNGLVIVVPGLNQESMKLARSVAKEINGFIRMFAKSKPERIVKNSEKRVFGVSSCIG